MINFKDVKEKIKNNTVLSVIIASVALVVSSIIIGHAVKNTFLVRTLTVKGASERTIKSDFAIWNVAIEEKNENLQSAQSMVEKNLKILKYYLKEKGFKDEEIENTTLIVDEDREYESKNGNSKTVIKYAVKGGFVIKSKDVDLVSNTYVHISDLIKKGVKIKSSRYGNSYQPHYLFKGFKLIKDEMIREATKNALKTANSFASDAKDKVKGIKTANQGVFQITPELSSNNYDNEAMYIMKNIRIVTTITYILE